MFIYICIYVYIYIYIFIYKHVCILLWSYIHIFCIYTFNYIYIHVNIYTYVVHTHRHIASEANFFWISFHPRYTYFPGMWNCTYTSLKNPTHSQNGTCKIQFASMGGCLFDQCEFKDGASERWGAGVETQKNVRGEIGGWGRVPFNETYAPLLGTIYDGA